MNMKRLLIYLLLGFSILPSWAVPSGPLQLPRGGESKHPGLLHSQSSIERMQRLFEEQNPVAMGSYMKLVNDAKSRADYAMRGPFDIIARDGQYGKTKTPCENDFLAAYYNVLIFISTHDAAHAEKAMEIIRAYSKSLVRIDGHDAPLCAALQGFILVNACELLRYVYKGWKKSDTRKTEEMFRSVFLPVLDEFDRQSPYANGNWGAAVCKMRMAIAVYCNDDEQYHRAIKYYEEGNDNGALRHYIGESGQCQESGRDQAHVMLGLGQLAEICEVAWSQGDDLYSALDNRLLKGYEYTSKANLGYPVPFTTWTDLTGKYSNWTVLSEGALGQWRAVFEIVYNHYVGRKHLSMPFTSQVLGHFVRPEGAGFTCDNPGFGTFLFYQDTEVDKTSTLPTIKSYSLNERRDYSPTEDPVIRLPHAASLTLVRTVDCWPEYWDLKPVRKSGEVYEYEPLGAKSRNGYLFGKEKARTTFLVEEFNPQRQLEYCKRQVQRSLSELQPIDFTHSPRHILNGEHHWHLRDAKSPEEWCSGFWPGILWMTDNTAEARGYTHELEYLAYRPIYDHDLGFQMIGSFLKGYEATHDEHYKAVLLAAADSLATLFNPRVGTLLSWPRNVGMFGGHNTIIDNMINLELLLFSGKKENIDIACRHADTTMKYHFRQDATVNHVAVYNPKNGKHLRNCTHQGFSDSSLWSRGQAWAIYGYTMMYRFTHQQRYLDFAIRVTDVMLHRLPADRIPLWDMDAPADKQFKDSSAAAIMASALVELSKYVPADKSATYLNEAKAMLTSLSSADYQSRNQSPSFLMHSVGNLPAGSEIDASIIYADYYYLEALQRLINY